MPPPISPPCATEPPTRVRYGVLGFACLLAMITYLDRACIGSAAGAFVHDLHLPSIAQFNGVFTAFTLAYALFEVPTGWLGDVFGPRRVLMRIVLWWSAFTVITGCVGWKVAGVTLGGLWTLIAVRFLFGMGEAGAFPNITRALHNWFPVEQRGFAQGAVWMSGRLMGGLTPLVWTLLVESAGSAAEQGSWLLPAWRRVFWLFGLVGAAWCVAFFLWFRNRPEEKSSVNAAELALIRGGAQAQAETQTAEAGIPWRRLATSRNLWALCLMYACQSYGWYFYMTYLPNCLETHYGVTRDSLIGAIYKGGPLWMGAVGCLVGGLLTDRFVRRTGNRRWGRRLFGVLGHSVTGLCFLLCPLAPSAFGFFLVISLAGFATDLTMGAGWSACQDIGRRYAAIVAGSMNMIGNFGGAAANWIFGLVLQRGVDAHAVRLGIDVAQLTPAQSAVGLWHGYEINFLICAAVYVVGVLCWLRIDATEPLETP